MPLYTFKARDGSMLEEFYAVSERPKVGARIRRGGKTYRRVDDFTVQKPIVKEYAHIARQLHLGQRKMKDGSNLYPRVNALGQPVFHNRREIDEYTAKRAEIGKPVKYDR